LPKAYCRIDVRVDGVLWGTVRSLLPDELAHALELSVREIGPNADAIKAAVMRNETGAGCGDPSGIAATSCMTNHRDHAPAQEVHADASAAVDKPQFMHSPVISN
jgi:hypothetical protein